MSRIIVRELILDKYNLEHIKKHNVTEEEVKFAGNNFIYHRKTYNNRYLAIARVNSRILTLVLSRQGQCSYYLVTARDADKKERRVVYEKERKQNS